MCTNPSFNMAFFKLLSLLRDCHDVQIVIADSQSSSFKVTMQYSDGYIYP